MSSHGITRARQRLGLAKNLTDSAVAALLFALIEKGTRLKARDVAAKNISVRSDAQYYKVRYEGRSYIIVVHKPSRNIITVLYG